MTIAEGNIVCAIRARFTNHVAQAFRHFFRNTLVDTLAVKRLRDLHTVNALLIIGVHVRVFVEKIRLALRCALLTSNTYAANGTRPINTTKDNLTLVANIKNRINSRLKKLKHDVNQAVREEVRN